MAITKQQFLDGKEFTLAGGNYKLNDGGLSILRVYRTPEGKEMFIDSEANVDKVGNKIVSTYTFVFSRQIKHRLRFEDMELYNPIKK